MRILYCNKYDYPFSGTEAYLFDLIERMDRRGHQTALFSMDHGSTAAFTGRAYRIAHCDFKDPRDGFFTKVKKAGHALYSISAQRAMGKCIADFSPDLAHVRSIYHHLSPSILWELKRRHIPVLYHVNDFKIICPSYNLVAHGHPCEACGQGAFHHVVTEGCYPAPRANTLVLAAEAYLHKWLRTYESCVDLFLAPSKFVQGKLIAYGISSDRIEVLSHFQRLPPADRLAGDEGYVLYFGRLSTEKGLDELLHALVQVPHVHVVIAGDGPERDRLQALARSLNLTHVVFAGQLAGEELQKLIAGCTFSLFPSRAYETLGKSILESYAYARPVVASDLGSRREFVEHGVTGLLYAPGDRNQLAHSIGFLFSRPDLVEKMGNNGRARIQARHDPEDHLQKLSEIYARLSFSSRLTSFPESPKARPRQGVRVAFIGGRGVVSKYSGIESWYEQAGHELAQLGHEVTVYCRSYFTPAKATHNGMRIRRLPTIRSKHWETFVHTLLSTAHAMTGDYDVVHYHCLGPALFSFLPRLVGKKTVVTVQGLDWRRAKWGAVAASILRLGEAAAVTLPNKTIVVSQTLQRYYRDHHRRETIYVPNGAAAIRRRPLNMLRDWDLIPDDYVLFLGRFSPEKNCLLLIEAFEKIGGSAKLVLAGGSSHSDAYVRNLRKHESGRIRFLPWVSGDDLEELLSNAAVFVLPSELEGLSLALLDAMAAGVCVLTSDIPENCEVVEGAGFTFRRGNKDDLERMLDVLMRNPELRREASIRERERIQSQYQWPAIAEAIEAVYLSALGWPHADWVSRPELAAKASSM
ncbi:MAG: glycosyltransferase family 4 protein [Terriglobales bacterium]